MVVLYLFRRELKNKALHTFVGIVIAILLILGLFFGENIAYKFEQKIYQDPIVYVEDTNYQKNGFNKRQ